MKKLIALLLALVMVFALAACSTTNEPAKENNNETSTDGKLYIPVMAKGFQHQFWQAVKTGAEAAAKDYDVEIYFDGPASETEIDAQVNMVKTEMAKNPKAMALAALSTDAVTEILEECASKNIPVIGFDSGVPGDTTGAVKATACTNNESAAAIAAEKFNENETVVEAMKNATSDNPVIIGCLSQDAVSASVMGRTTGFVDKMAEIAETYQPGKVSIEGHAKWEKKVENPAIIIEVAISATTEATAVQTAANSLLRPEVPLRSSAPTKALSQASSLLFPTVRIWLRAASTTVWSSLVSTLVRLRRTRSVRAGSMAPSRRIRIRSATRQLSLLLRLPTARLFPMWTPALSGMTPPTSMMT